MALNAEAGTRDKLVTIEQRPSADSVDEGGYPIDGAFTTLGTAWMHKRDVAEFGQSERFTSEQLAASFDTEWEMPYQANMDPEIVNVPKLRRLLYRGRHYDIVHASVTQVYEGKGIKLRTLAASGVNA